MRVSKPEIQELPRLEDRASFVYLERCTINVSGGAIIAYREGQKISIPSMLYSCLHHWPRCEHDYRRCSIISSRITDSMDDF